MQIIDILKNPVLVVLHMHLPVHITHFLRNINAELFIKAQTKWKVIFEILKRIES